MTHITRLIFNSMSLCRKTFIVIFWDGSVNVILLKFQNLSGAKECRSRRSRKMLQNAPTLAIEAVDTEENERLQFGVNYSVYSLTFSVYTHNSDST